MSSNYRYYYGQCNISQLPNTGTIWVIQIQYYTFHYHQSELLKLLPVDYQIQVIQTTSLSPGIDAVHTLSYLTRYFLIPVWIDQMNGRIESG